jgi:hypothetical protein
MYTIHVTKSVIIIIHAQCCGSFSPVLLATLGPSFLVL